MSQAGERRFWCGSYGVMVASIRVLICDDAAAYGELVSAWLAADPAIQVVGHATSGASVLAMADELLPDVILLDNHLPDVIGGAPVLVPRVRARAPNAAIVLCSAMPSEELAGLARVTNAEGHVSKASPPAAVRAAILDARRARSDDKSPASER